MVLLRGNLKIFKVNNACTISLYFIIKYVDQNGCNNREAVAANHHNPWLVHNKNLHSTLTGITVISRHDHCYQSTRKKSGTTEQTFMKYTWTLYSLSRHHSFCESQTILVILHNTVQFLDFKLSPCFDCSFFSFG